MAWTSFEEGFALVGVGKLNLFSWCRTLEKRNRKAEEVLGPQEGIA